MLRDKNSSAIVAVSDMERARQFYGETLGLRPGPAPMDEDCIASYRTGDTVLTVYQSDYAGTNQANAVTWDVGGDLDAIVADLTGKGVTFEHYDMPGMVLKGDVHRAGDMGLAWFKDPDGNILHLIGG
jgi:catechol 2,3-dioxygenase-like lactoylglutathione lyase family enzyme